MKIKAYRHVLSALYCTVAVLFSPTSSASAQTLASATVDGTALSGPGQVVYVESNETRNAILAFHRGEDGTLTKLVGSPFLTGGKGVIDPSFQFASFDTDQNIVIDRDRGLLFAVNSGSNTIAVFRINPVTGTLMPVAGSPFSSGGISPVSIGLRGDQIVIVNQNMDPAQNIVQHLPSIVTRHVLPGGQIIKFAGDTETLLPANSSPSQALTANVAPFVFGAELNSAAVTSYRLAPGGELAANPDTPVPSDLFTAAAPPTALGLWANPIAKQLYVGFPSINALGVYTWDDFGQPIFERSVSNSGAVICWFRTNRAGTLLYTGNSGNPPGAPQSVSVYDTSNPANPVELQTLELRGFGQVFQFSLDPTEHYIYILSQRGLPSIPAGQGNSLHVLKIAADGLVSEVPSSPLSLNVQTFARPQGVAVY